MKNFCLILFCFIVISCSTESNSNAAQTSYEIVGKLVNATGNLPIYLDKLSFEGNQAVDTAILATDGTFKMKGNIPTKGLYLLRISQEKTWILIVDAGKTTFSADFNDIFKYTVSGKENKILLNFVNSVGSVRTGLQQYQNEFMMAQMANESEKMQLAQTQYNNLVTQYNNQIMQMADTTSSALVALFAATMLNVEQNANYLNKFIVKNQATLTNNTLMQEFSARVAKETKLTVGGKAPDFSLKTAKGENISLADAKGKVVLIDFWASWCRPCRMENPNVVRLYNQYKEKGFTVFSVSLDNNMQKWVSAIEQDGLIWNYHGSNLLGWQCPVAQLYKVNSIPQTYLIDKNGDIVGKNLRGIELETKLKELFGS
jgi:peroxiredoxin